MDELTAWWRLWNACDETSSGALEPEVAGETAPQIVRTERSRCGDGTKVQIQKVERIGYWWLTEDDNPSRVDYGRTIVSFFGLDQ